MNDDDFEMIRDQARRYLDDALPPDYLKSLLEQPGSFDRRSWDAAVALGWPATAVAEEQGGLGLGWRGICLLAEELGRKTGSIPLIASAVVARTLLGCQEPKAHAAAAALVSGERAACLAIMRAGEAGLAFTPSVHLSGGLLNGATAVTAFAACADGALVVASENGVLCLVYVDLGSAGVVRQVVTSLDNSRAAAVLQFDGACALRLASGDEAQQRLLEAASRAALATAFEQVGGAQACLDMAVAYALERKAFGQVIGRFQGIKFKLAEMYVHLEIAKGCAIDALEALESGDPQWQCLAAAARVAATRAYDYAARENIQTHGAIGVTWEALPHHHYRRSRVLALELGSTVVWRERLLAGIGLAAVH